MKTYAKLIILLIVATVSRSLCWLHPNTHR